MTKSWLKNTGLGLLIIGSVTLTGCSESNTNATIDLDEGQALYTVTVTNLFSEDVPIQAHFTKIIGMVHQTENALWQNNTLASDGVVEVAERGSIGTLSNEISTHISTGEALDKAIIGESGIAHLHNGSESNVSEVCNILVSDSHNLVSFVSMIGPSPDWFVGINSISLHENGDFRETVTANLVGYDSGTQDGTTFALQFNNSNTDTTPVQTISTLNDNSTVNHPIILGTVVFTKQQ